MPKVTVIVVTWNQRSLLEECLVSLDQQSLQDFELIVVDNASEDDTAEFLRSRRDDRMQVISNAENRGFCGANNQGIEAARGEFVALLNNDAVAENGWLEALVSSLEHDPSAGMAASKIVTYRDPEIIDKTGHLIFLDGQNRGRGTGRRDEGQFDEQRDTAWPDGCAALYRRSMLEQIGGFEEEFFAYADDAELGLRARIAGWTAIYVPDAVVRHHAGTSLGEYSPRQIFLIERNRIWLVAKLFPLPLLLVNPLLTALRAAALVISAAAGRGDLSAARKGQSTGSLLKCFLRAQAAGWLGLPRMLKKRKAVNKLRKLNSLQTIQLLWRYRITLRELVSHTR